MKFLFSALKSLSVVEILTEFSQIPLSDDQLCLVGDFVRASYFESSCLPEALLYIPRHIQTLILSGQYQYRYAQMCDSRNYSFLGGYLEDIVAHIPKSIQKLTFEFLDDPEIRAQSFMMDSFVAKNFSRIFRKIPQHVQFLNLSSCVMQDETPESIVAMYMHMPKTILSLKMNPCCFGKYSPELRKKLLQYFNSFLKELYFEHQNILFGLTVDQSMQFFYGLKQPSSIEHIAFISCGLNEAKPELLEGLLSALPFWIRALSLSGNFLYQFHINFLKAFFKRFPKKLKYLDLAENDFMYLDEHKFKQLMTLLPQKLEELRLFERLTPDVYYSPRMLQCNYALLPPQIHTLCITYTDHYGLKTISENLLCDLGAQIIKLDLSQTDLLFCTQRDYLAIFNHLVPSLRQIVLAHNALACLSPPSIQELIFRIPEFIFEIFLGHNGLDRLSWTALQAWLASLPDRVYHFGIDSLYLRHDGHIVSYFPRGSDWYFKPMGKVRHFSELLDYLPCWIQLMRQRNLSLNFMWMLGSYLLHDPKLVHAVAKTLQKGSSLVIRSQRIPFGYMGIEDSIATRIALATGDYLDLGCCGLSNCIQEEDYQRLYQDIPEQIHSLSLRNNGLQFSKSSLLAFLLGLKYLPEHIYYLDLSGNEFEWITFEELKLNFIHLPSTVEYISLTQERPVALAYQVMRIKTLNHYQEMTSHAGGLLEQACFLLNDYTQENSRFKRLIFGYWNRRHIPEVTRILYYLYLGYLTHIEDILQQLNIIEMPNEAGALAQSMAYLFRQYHLGQQKSISLVPH